MAYKLRSYGDVTRIDTPDGHTMASTPSGQKPLHGVRRPCDLVDSTSDLRFEDLYAVKIVYEKMVEWPVQKTALNDINRSLLINNADKETLISMWNNDTIGLNLDT